MKMIQAILASDFNRLGYFIKPFAKNLLDKFTFFLAKRKRALSTLFLINHSSSFIEKKKNCKVFCFSYSQKVIKLSTFFLLVFPFLNFIWKASNYYFPHKAFLFAGEVLVPNRSTLHAFLKFVSTLKLSKTRDVRLMRQGTYLSTCFHTVISWPPKNKKNCTRLMGA
ncbi:hypothetical protein DB42_CO00230 [Neochlamydia sp. EPS4]|nr:hypothetical protein DB42_CO00230 [Neochlamydia sp. EPS4]